MIHKYECYPKRNNQATTSCILYIQENIISVVLRRKVKSAESSWMGPDDYLWVYHVFFIALSAENLFQLMFHTICGFPQDGYRFFHFFLIERRKSEPACIEPDIFAFTVNTTC